jgi:predicted transcriptional regulator
MDTMDEKQRLHLQKMIAANNTEDQTELIRNLKHSDILRNDLNNMVLIKAKYRDQIDKIHLECMNECSFLFTYYTDIYNKIRKDEIDISILHQFLDVLKKIEDGELDQHEGSFQVGTLLKKLYVDSALKKAEKLDEANKSNKEETLQPSVQINWRQFKKMTR